MAETKILLGSTQTLVSYPQVAPTGEALREPLASVEVTIGTPSVAIDDDTFASATVDAVNTTLGAAVAEGAPSLTIASAAIKRGRQYLVADGDGGFVAVESRTEGTSTTMRLGEPLVRALANGAAVRGWAVSKALTTEQTAQEGEAVALWRGTRADGSVVTWTQLFTIVRRMPQWTLTPTKLTKAWPVVRTLRSRQDVDLEEIIAAALDHRVRPLLEARGINEEDVHSVSALEPLHALACVLQLASGNASVGVDVFARLESRWNALVEETFASSRWHTQPQDEAPAARDEAKDAVAMGIRLTR